MKLNVLIEVTIVILIAILVFAGVVINSIPMIVVGLLLSIVYGIIELFNQYN